MIPIDLSRKIKLATSLNIGYSTITGIEIFEERRKREDDIQEFVLSMLGVS
ncbi:hypothetical protein V6M85_06505 [Sulfolobus tengchongensis]|uniref:Uncharacterized protein n=1 Tax=Sulfolobus tengchongensis TaxID=207809 RepID=A0AAX4L3N2_9CREN